MLYFPNEHPSRERVLGLFEEAWIFYDGRWVSFLENFVWSNGRSVFTLIVHSLGHLYFEFEFEFIMSSDPPIPQAA